MAGRSGRAGRFVALPASAHAVPHGGAQPPALPLLATPPLLPPQHPGLSAGPHTHRVLRRYADKQSGASSMHRSRLLSGTCRPRPHIHPHACSAGDLFTGNCFYSMAALIEGKISALDGLRILVVSYFSNLVGLGWWGGGGLGGGGGGGVWWGGDELAWLVAPCAPARSPPLTCLTWRVCTRGGQRECKGAACLKCWTAQEGPCGTLCTALRKPCRLTVPVSPPPHPNPHPSVRLPLPLRLTPHRTPAPPPPSPSGGLPCHGGPVHRR